MKNSNDTRDLPACSALPEPTAPQLTPKQYVTASKQSKP